MKILTTTLVLAIMTTSQAQTKIPDADKNAPANVQTATFALG